MDQRTRRRSTRVKGNCIKIMMAKHHNYLCRLVKKSAKEDKDRYIREICQGVKDAWTQFKTRAVYEGIRKIIGKHAPQVKSIKDEQGKVITDPSAVKKRWKDYFDKLYHDPNEVQEGVLKNLPKAGNTEDIPVIPVSKKMRMHINTAKTEIQYLGKGDNRFRLQADGQQLEQTDNFVYQGGNISTNEGLEGDISGRIGLARGIVQSLSKIW